MKKVIILDIETLITRIVVAIAIPWLFTTFGHGMDWRTWGGYLSGLTVGVTYTLLSCKCKKI